MTNKIAIAQITSTTDREQNLKKVLPMISEAADNGADLIAFPEALLCLGDQDAAGKKIAETIPGDTVRLFQEEAQKRNISILMGSIPEKDAENPGKTFNTSVLMDRKGELVGVYQKIHLFDVDLPTGRFMESDTVSAGKELVCCDHEIGKIGLTICYDLRFPNLYQRLTTLGAQIIFNVAAFTHETGKAHWLPLLRARAIENQVYIAASGQYGWHGKKRRTFGHSVLIDPWGKVIAEAPDGEGIIYGDIDLSLIASVRQKIPMQNHKVPGID